MAFLHSLDQSRSFKLDPIYVRFRRKPTIELFEKAFGVTPIAAIPGRSNRS